MKIQIDKAPTLSSLNLNKTLSDAGVELSDRTIRRRLQKEFKLPARRPSKKPMLTEKQRRMRLQFCRLYKDKPKQWWSQVMFSDESVFQQVRNCGSNYIRRPSGKRYDPRFTIKTVKYPPSVMIWGAISAAGRAGLVVCKKVKG